MNKLKLFGTFCGLFLIFGCGTSQKSTIINESPPLSGQTKVEVFAERDIVPEGSILIGKIKIGDTGFSINCNYDDAIRAAKEQARAMGGNYLQITKHKTPDLLSTCHRLEANVFLVK
jgi:hypothetical protein